MTSASDGRGPYPLLAGLAAAVVTAVWVWLWVRADNAPCESQAVLGCSGTPIALLVIGIPVVLIALYVALRLCGANAPAFGLLVCAGVTVALPAATEAIDPPMWVWPVVIGVVATIYTALSRR